MYGMYLVTGATGYLGSAVVKRLRADGAAVRALVMPGDALAGELPEGVEAVAGCVDQKETLRAFFAGAGKGACVVHCAGVVSIASRNGDKLWNVNVEGTRNVVELCAEEGAAKLVYVSSVHAIPEKPKGEAISECEEFSPELVAGDYAKSKAAATACALAAAKAGLNVSIVHPSGIIGPYDRGKGSVTGTVIAYCNGKLPVGVAGGYDFVDVRDVADGIVACAHRGRPDECYILSNRYVSIREVLETLRKLTRGRKIRVCVPLGLVKRFASLCEKASLRRKVPLFLTPYSVEVLGSNSAFCHDKATRELGYRPRTIEETLGDMVSWLTARGSIRPRKARRP